MLFNSADYLIFLVLMFFGFWALRRFRAWRVLFLILGSCFFYMSWNRYLILLILYSTLIDWWTGNAIARTSAPRKRKFYLLVSLVTNLGLLFVFKYANFFFDAFNQLAQWLELPLHAPTLQLLLPVGISFYTFQTLSYTIDIYRGQLEPARNLREFFLYVIFFPQLVAGPIVRAVDFVPQLDRTPVPNVREGIDGLYRIAIGLVKKVAFADYLALNVVERVFERPELFSSLECLVAVYAYAFQIYFDFSAYSDIAIGSAKMLGYHMPENFNAPYTARNLQEFWHRWHMTLSTWLRDYLYIPLGGSRHGAWKTYRNLFLTMLLGGLWHGASWTFVVWGAMHGVGLALTRMYQRGRENTTPNRWLEPFGVFFTFHYVCLAWIFFRAPSFEVAASMLQQIAGLSMDCLLYTSDAADE